MEKERRRFYKMWQVYFFSTLIISRNNKTKNYAIYLKISSDDWEKKWLPVINPEMIAIPNVIMRANNW